MSIIIFLIILALLIIVHEYGHFIVAKKGGIRVDEFGLGYPPRAKTLFTRKGTKYTLNWLPFGGFVKIFGENPDKESISGPDKDKSFVNKPKWLQASVLFAGPFFNFLFAWLLIFITLMIGLPTVIDDTIKPEYVSEATTIVTSVMPESPAEVGGLMAGDMISSISVSGVEYRDLNTEMLSSVVSESPEATYFIKYDRLNEEMTTLISPSDIDGQALLGVGIQNYGIYKPNFFRAFYESFEMTGVMIAKITITLADLVIGAFSGEADISSLTGPVGIVGLIGDASVLGFVYLLSFTALISINLGIINLIPFPALDGGRLLFILIERIKGTPVKPKIANSLNAIGFVALILLMVFVTYRDILNLV